MPDVRIRSPRPADAEATTAVSDEVDPIAATAVSGSEPAAASRPDPLVGRQLKHFRVEAQLGRGGMGAVYRAWDLSLERPVALKVLHRESAETRARFMREARAQAQIRHPNVVPIHFVGEDDGIAFLVMDLVEGESLSDLLDREGRLPVDRALDIVDAVARALEAGLERGLVHRDVKPSNILLDQRGHVLLADFGLAKQVAAAEDPSVEASSGPAASGLAITRAGTLVGTPAYAAPEQATGASVDHRADVYAIGVTLYEAVCGHLPFTAPTLPELVEQHRSEPPLSPRTVVPELGGPRRRSCSGCCRSCRSSGSRATASCSKRSRRRGSVPASPRRRSSAASRRSSTSRWPRSPWACSPSSCGSRSGRRSSRRHWASSRGAGAPRRENAFFACASWALTAARSATGARCCAAS